MGAIVPLPTAATRKVRQRAYHQLPVRMRREAVRTGKLVRAPIERRREPTPEELRWARWGEAGIVRNAPTMIAATVLLGLPEKDRREALGRLAMLAERMDDPAARAAFEWVQTFCDGASQ